MNTAAATAVNVDGTGLVPAPLLPKNPSLLRRMAVGWRSLKILEKDPAHPVAGCVFNACLDYGVYAGLVAELQSSDEGRALLAHRPSLQGEELDLSALAALPEGTFGRAVAAYFERNALTPFVTPLELKTDLDYLSKRYRETHDFFHVLSDYGTDFIGEMELQAFAMGNLGIRGPMMILAYGFIGSERAEGDIDRRAYIARTRAAYRVGKASKPLLAFPYEQHWETPLAELRAMLIAPREDSAH